MASSSLDIDELIARLLSFKPDKRTACLTEEELRTVCDECKEVLLSQPSLLELAAPIRVLGDIHGQYNDLLRLFEFGGLPPASNYLFMGDYVDRGEYGLEVVSLLFCYKLKYPENFFLLRGNHEASEINRIYGFYAECRSRYSVNMWTLINAVFDCLPFTAIIEDKILCVHGGLSPELSSLEQLKNIRRPTQVTESGLICDLIWADPEEGQRGWGESERGISFTFGEDVLAKFLQRFDLDLVCRAHQVVEDGYEFFAQRQLVTLFSAPNYCGDFDNSAAMMYVDENLMCSFQVLKPATGKALQGKRPSTPKR